MERLRRAGLRPTVGLEIHVRLRTPTKLFCACPNDADAAPNTLVCPVCLGLPGSLPVLSGEVLEPAVRLGLALGCALAPASSFARKHYFYPDLPRNYQITQFARPLGTGGALAAGPGPEAGRVRVRRIHLEEDAGRLVHHPGGESGVDLNRAGAPLLEIVTEPDLATGAEARAWLQQLRRLVVHLGACDGDLERGSLRCDANVGLGHQADGESDGRCGPWSEVKNLNSLRAVRRAVDHELERLAAAVAAGEPLRRETRAWDERGGRTAVLRVKETSPDYRYFPDPDLPDLALALDWVAHLADRMPELPAAREARWVRDWGLDPDAAATLIREPAVADYFEAVVAGLGGGDGGEVAAAPDARLAANWIATGVLAVWDGAGLDAEPCPVAPGNLADLLRLVREDRISGAAGKRILTELAARPGARAADLVAELGLAQVCDPDLIAAWCREVLAAHRAEVAALHGGKAGLLDFLVGRVLASSEGRASPPLVRKELQKQLAL